MASCTRLLALTLTGLTFAAGCGTDEPATVDTGVQPKVDAGFPADTGVSGADAGFGDASSPADMGPPPPQCTEDARSPNHSFAASSEVAVGDAITGLQICPNTDDFYRLTLAEGQRVSIQVGFTHADGDIDVEVLDATEAVVGGAASATNNETVGFRAETAGVYTIRVFGFQGAAAPYGLDILPGCQLDSECTAPALCDRLTNACGEVAEPTCGRDGALDPNGTNSTAIPLDFATGTSSVAGLSSCAGDLDFFAFTAVMGDSFVINTTSTDPMAVFRTFLVNADGDLVANSDTGELNAPHIAAGDWYLIVFLVEGPEDTGYSLSGIKTGGACTSNTTCAGGPLGQFCQGGICGAIEGNGAVALGDPCDDNTDCDMDAEFCFSQSNSADGFFCDISCEADADCAPVGGSAYCSEDRGVCFRPCAGNSDLCFTGDYCSATSSECVSRTCNFAGTCDAPGLECQWQNGSPEGACAELVAPTCGQGGVGEPNNTVATATPVALTAGTATVMGSICGADADIYSITVTEPSNISALATWAGVADVDIVIAPAADTRAVGAGFGTEPQEEAGSAMFVAPGTYYIIVGPWEIEPVPDMDYSLAITVTAAACGGDMCEMTNPLRLTCDPSGACVDFDGMGAVAIGGACDDDADCAPDADLCIVGTTMTFNNMCTITCTDDMECTAAIPGSQCFDLGNGTGACLLP